MGLARWSQRTVGRFPTVTVSNLFDWALGLETTELKSKSFIREGEKPSKGFRGGGMAQGTSLNEFFEIHCRKESNRKSAAVGVGGKCFMGYQGPNWWMTLIHAERTVAHLFNPGRNQIGTNRGRQRSAVFKHVGKLQYKSLHLCHGQGMHGEGKEEAALGGKNSQGWERGQLGWNASVLVT